MAEKKIEWTEQQRRAVTQRGVDVLVTASAGTGKTAVLSGRFVDMVADKSIQPDVRNILVLTFTEAAAEQMRARISQQLKRAFLESGDPRLASQLIFLEAADISTIHSFCKRIITEHFYELGIDPAFRIIDSDEQKLLKAEALERCIDWAWKQGHLVQGLEQLLRRRDLRPNDGFLAKIITLSDFLDSVVSRENWYQRASVLAEKSNTFASGLGKKQKEVIADKLRHIQNQLRCIQSLYEKQCPNGDWAAKYQQAVVDHVTECIELIEAGNWEKCAERIRSFDKPTVRRPKDMAEPLSGMAKDTVKDAVDAFAKLADLAVLNPDYLDKLGGAVGLQTKVIVELVKKFDQLYSHAKEAVNCLDFADLEHYALKLLTDKESTEDKLSPSATALALRNRYKYVFVDEYQDINPVQQAILGGISTEGNIFVVGDVKQSIYAFRGAEPKIFLTDLKSASIDPKNAPKGLRVDLNANFRSVKGILDFANKIFSRIMTAALGNIDYDESAALKPAIPPKSRIDGKPVVELHILDEESKDEKSQNLHTFRQHQAFLIAQRIRQIVGAETGKAEFQIYDPSQDKTRDVEYRDIVILMRSPAKRVNEYMEILRWAGVPVKSDVSGGYFEATEVTDMLSLLKVLDNQQRDIELASVLRSPFFNISDTELAKIELNSKSQPKHRNFYDRILDFCANAEDSKLANKLKNVLAQIEQWRQCARRDKLPDLIWLIYRQTGYLSFVLALPNGQSRKANLLKLHDRAIQFEGFASNKGTASLARFIEFIEKLQEAGEQWTSPEPEAETRTAVRIMSVHKSKGLEFGVVFLAELNSRFNKADIQADCLPDADGALGLQIIDRRANSKLSSLAHQVIAEQKLSDNLAEEMRILYVATTRARERLILTGSKKKNRCGRILCNGLLLGNDTINDWQLRSCQSPLEWVLYGLSDQKNLHEAFGTGLAKSCDEDNLLSIKLHSQAELDQLAEGVSKDKAHTKIRRMSKTKPIETTLLAKVKSSLAWQYGFGRAPLLPAKRSVTQLTHRQDEYAEIDYSQALSRRPKVTLPAGELTSKIQGRTTGTATHLLIASLDLSKPVDKAAIEQVKDKLLAEDAVTEVVAASIDTDSIVQFFESRLGRKVLTAYPDVWREWPFSLALPASQYQPTGSGDKDETIILQGIIDMLIRTPQGLSIIDFKTDRVAGEQVDARAELYRKQLELYSQAVEAILKTKVLDKWLYFLTPGCGFEVK